MSAMLLIPEFSKSFGFIPEREAPGLSVPCRLT
jgi:hypothetical protein